MTDIPTDDTFVRASLIPLLEDTADLIHNLIRSYYRGDLDEKDLTAEVFLIGKAMIGWNDNADSKEQLTLLEVKNLAVMNYLKNNPINNPKDPKKLPGQHPSHDGGSGSLFFQSCKYSSSTADQPASRRAGTHDDLTILKPHWNGLQQSPFYHTSQPASGRDG